MDKFSMVSMPTAVLEAWGRPEFAQLVHDALIRGDALFGPLQRGMAHGSHALIENARLMLLRAQADEEALDIDVGVSYASITPGCACEADPTPMAEIPEFVRLRIRINRISASARVDLLD